MMRFIHISDTHIGPSKDFSLYSLQPYPCLEKIIDHINKLKDRPDFVLHTGDIAATIPDDDSFKNAQELLSKLNYPVYYVTGNHDRSSFIQQYLKQGEKINLVSDISKNAYYFDQESVRFIILDGRGPDVIEAHGSLSNNQFEALEKHFQDEKKFIIAIHFPTIPLHNEWLDRDMLMLERERIHTLFAQNSNKILGVLSGHIHRGTQTVRDGVLYSSVGSTFMQFQSYPSTDQPVFESTGRSYCNYVTIEDGQMTIKEYSIPNGNDMFVKTKDELGL